MNIENDNFSPLRINMYTKTDQKLDGVAYEADFDHAIPENIKPYYFRQRFGTGRDGYAYLLVDAKLEDELLFSINKGIIPNFAAIIDAGVGEPNAQTRFRMERYYGFSEQSEKSLTDY